MSLKTAIEEYLLSVGYAQSEADPSYWYPPEGEEIWADKLMTAVIDCLEREA